MLTKINFAKLLARNGAVGVREEPKELSSGKLSHWYIDGRKLLRTLALRDQVVSYVIEMMSNYKILEEEFDTVLGVPEAGIKWGDAVSEHLIRRGLMGDGLYQQRLLENSRKTGVGKDWVGGISPKRVVVMEDVITTGGKVFEFVNNLKEKGVEVGEVIGLVDRLQLYEGLTAEERFRAGGLELCTITSAKEVLPEYLRILQMENPELAKFAIEKIGEEIRREYEEAGRESPINLEELK